MSQFVWLAVDFLARVIVFLAFPLLALTFILAAIQYLALGSYLLGSVLLGAGGLMVIVSIRGYMAYLDGAYDVFVMKAAKRIDDAIKAARTK